MPRRKRTSDVRTALTRLNAVVHGLSADAPVVLGLESVEEWQAFRDALVADVVPQGAFETQLVERIAALMWRIRRVQVYERESVRIARERVEYDFSMDKQRKWRGDAVTPADADARVDDARRCLAIIEQLGETTPDTPLAPGDVWAILDNLAGAAEQERDEFLAGVDAVGDGGEWTAGRLIAVLRTVAAREDESFAGVLAEMLRRGREIVSGRERDRVDFYEELARMRGERIIPDAPTLDRIIRYETAMNRMMHQAIGQLEASQSRRKGVSAPLTRVQMYGGPGG